MNIRYFIQYSLFAFALSASIAHGAVSAGQITSCTVDGNIFYAGKTNTIRVTAKATSGSGATFVEPLSTPSGWSISPSYVEANLDEGASFTAVFMVTPPAHNTTSATIVWEFYRDVTWPLSNVLLAQYYHTLTPVLPPCTVTAAVGSGGGGTVSPSGSTNVAYGSTMTYTTVPASGYSISNVAGISGGAWNSGSVFSTRTYTTPAITNDLSLTFNFHAWPDLSVSRLVVSNTSTSGWTNRAYAGDSFKVYSYTKNTGKTVISSGLVSPASKTGFFLSTSPTSTNGASYLANDWAPNIPNGSIAIGAEDEGEFSFTVPSDTAPGQYYLLAYADYEGSMDEYSESNNLLAYPITVESKYDLTVSRAVLSNKNYSGWTNRGYPGQEIQVTSYTKNTGLVTISSGAISPASKTGFFLSPSSTSTNGGVYLANDWAPNLLSSIAVGAEDSGSETFTIPDWSPGLYYFLAVADYENALNESNEGNNILAIPFYIVGQPAFTNVEWWNPRDVTHGDTTMLYADVVNIPIGTVCTFTIYECDSPWGRDFVTNLTGIVTNDLDSSKLSVRAVWVAEWMSDQSGDPEFYFEVSYADVTAESLREDGEYLTVCQESDRMAPSPVIGDFYFDPAGVVPGEATANVPLTDDRIPIILVHGMGGDAKIETLNYWYGWVNSDTNAALGYFNTPEMRAKYRVYRYVYDTRDFISTNALKLAEFVNTMYATNAAFSERQVIIMAHSMGGLVSRYAMNMDTNFRSRVHRLVTLGSPHLGSQGANPTWLRHAFPTGFNTIISTIYNVAGLHNNTAGCFDLAWYDPNQIPAAARSASTIESMYGYYNRGLLEQSLLNPFTGWAGMLATNADPKLVLYGGHADGMINDYMSKDWPSSPSSEVKTDHLGLWAAVMIFNNMHYADGSQVGNNDGLVPSNSAMLTDANAHSIAEKLDLTASNAEYLDHASYLDVASTMDYVKARLLSIIKTPIHPAAVTNAGRWRIVGEDGHWQKPGVSLGALKPGTYTIEFKDVEGWIKPVNTTVTVTYSETTTLTSNQTTYVQMSTNTAPSGITLSANQVEENAATGTLVGILGAVDADSGDTHTYTLVSGEGGRDNALFAISNNQLVVAAAINFEIRETHTIRIRATDAAGLWVEAVFTIDVLDVEEEPVYQPVDFEAHPISFDHHSKHEGTIFWEAPDGIEAYDIYTSTNLPLGFAHHRRVYNTTNFTIGFTNNMGFWCIRAITP